MVSKVFLSFEVFAQPFPCSYGCVTYSFLQQAGKSPLGTACHQALLGRLQITPGPHFPFRSRNLCPSSSAMPSYTLARVRPAHFKGLFQARWLLYHSEDNLPDASTSHFKSRRHHHEPPLKQRPFCLLVKCPYCSSIVPAHQFPQATYSALLYQHQSSQEHLQEDPCYLYFWSWLWKRTAWKTPRNGFTAQDSKGTVALSNVV